jgi:hypothetical protein
MLNTELDRSLIPSMDEISVEDRLKFLKLNESCDSDTQFYAHPYRVVNNPNYREIVQMGPKAIPLIIAALDAKPFRYFPALRALVGVNIDSEASTFREARERWLQWGKDLLK